MPSSMRARASNRSKRPWPARRTSSPSGSTKNRRPGPACASCSTRKGRSAPRSWRAKRPKGASSRTTSTGKSRSPRRPRTGFWPCAGRPRRIPADAGQRARRAGDANPRNAVRQRADALRGPGPRGRHGRLQAAPGPVDGDGNPDGDQGKGRPGGDPGLCGEPAGIAAVPAAGPQERAWRSTPGSGPGARSSASTGRDSSSTPTWSTCTRASGPGPSDGAKIAALCEKFEIDAIAIGNGTAGRETEEFVRSLQLPPEHPRGRGQRKRRLRLLRLGRGPRGVPRQGRDGPGRRLHRPAAHGPAGGTGQDRPEIHRRRPVPARCGPGDAQAEPRRRGRQLRQQRRRRGQHGQQAAAPVRLRPGTPVGPEHHQLPQRERPLQVPRRSQGSPPPRGQGLRAGGGLPAHPGRRPSARRQRRAPRELSRRGRDGDQRRLLGRRPDEE